MKMEEFTDFNDFGLKYLDNSFVFTAFQASGENDIFLRFAINRGKDEFLDYAFAKIF